MAAELLEGEILEEYRSVVDAVEPRRRKRRVSPAGSIRRLRKSSAQVAPLAPLAGLCFPRDSDSLFEP